MARAVRRSMHQMGNTARGGYQQRHYGYQQRQQGGYQQRPQNYQRQGRGGYQQRQGRLPAAPGRLSAASEPGRLSGTVSRVRGGYQQRQEPGRLSGTVSRVRAATSSVRIRGGYQNRQRGQGGYQQRQNQGGYQKPISRVRAATSSARASRAATRTAQQGRFPPEQSSAGEVSASADVSRAVSTIGIRA